MAELKFNDNGTISLNLGAQTITLRRTTIGEMFTLRDRISEITEEARNRLEAAVEELAEMEDDDPRAGELQDELTDHRRGFEWLLVPWYTEVFELLGSAPFPDNPNDLPSEMADMTLPNQMLEFWRTVPLAHSQNGPR